MRCHRVISCSGLVVLVLAGAGNAAAQIVSSVDDPSVVAPAADADLLAQRPTGVTLAPRRTMPGAGALFTSIGDDFLQIPKRDNLAILGMGAMGAVVAASLDRAIDRTPWGGHDAHEALEPGAIAGGFVAQTSAAFATYAIGRLSGSERTAQVGSELVRAQLLTQATTQLIKFSTQRTRPDGTSLSFPSGHSGSAFATATVLQRNFGWKAGVPAYAMAAWVAASRVQMKRHHLSDVIAGATLGILAGRAVTVSAGSSTFAVTPAVVPGGGGVTFVKIK
jgi:hypothetical protein